MFSLVIPKGLAGILDRAREIDEFRIRYGDAVFNKAVEMCRTTELDIMDCLEACSRSNYF